MPDSTGRWVNRMQWQCPRCAWVNDAAAESVSEMRCERSSCLKTSRFDRLTRSISSAMTSPGWGMRERPSCRQRDSQVDQGDS